MATVAHSSRTSEPYTSEVVQGRPPERLEDLPAHLQEELRRARSRNVDRRRVRVRARRAMGHGIAAALLVLVPGAWLVSLCVAPMAILNASLALRESRGVPELRGQRPWAIVGLAVSIPVLVVILIHVTRLAIWSSALEELWRVE